MFIFLLKVSFGSPQWKVDDDCIIIDSAWKNKTILVDTNVLIASVRRKSANCVIAADLSKSPPSGQSGTFCFFALCT